MIIVKQECSLCNKNIEKPKRKRPAIYLAGFFYGGRTYKVCQVKGSAANLIDLANILQQMFALLKAGV